MRKGRVPMLHAIDEDELNVKLTKDEIRDLVVDPPHGVSKNTKAISIYSLRLYKLNIHSLKMLNLKSRSLEGRIEKIHN